MADASRTAGIAADQTWRYREEILGRFEAAWRSGPRPRIEEFIPAPPGSNLHLLIEIIHLDVEYRLRAGETVATNEYAVRFPDLAHEPAALLSLARAAERRFADVGAGDTFFEFPERPSDSSETVPPLPSVAGYQVLCEVGRGGMGIVYRAQQTALGRIVALKMLRSTGEPTPAELARLRTEAEAVGRLQHANIVQIHDVGEAAGRPYQAMEFVEGMSLAARLKTG